MSISTFGSKLKFSICLFLVMFSINTYATIDFSLLPKDSNGKVINMNYNQAQEYCEGLGKRLPTALEFADFRESQGAWDIRETKYPNQGRNNELVSAEETKMWKQGEYVAYILHQRCNETGYDCVQFYYTKKGYVNPIPSLKDYGFWISTVNDSEHASIFGIGDSGFFELFIEMSENLSAVCVQK